MTVIAQAAELVPAVKALGIDAGDALERGEMDAAVYLLDQAGAGWGYRYEWERYGPFSEALAADLVALTDDDLAATDGLDPAVQVAVGRVCPLLDAPPGSVQPYTWIRLLASLDFLQRYAGTPLSSTARPPYIESSFEQPVIDAAVERLDEHFPLHG
jgi:hypothetical protein